ncbi:vomeronasal type-1 receptor 4-like [Psammomys obesus]|uniref:vomeronasal type-1 receptor 4-like n=1 Tax=Psammomys obesus TaxID=48139 RepID=UPI0024531E79|nr:vomeronasal type-1 receptor 4-like [Psammomys obesus]
MANVWADCGESYERSDDKKMVPENFSVGMFFLSQTVVGILGNWLLLFYYFMSFFTGKNLMPKDAILKHVTLANSLSIISRGIPQSMAGLGLKDFLDDNGCKFVMCLFRIARGATLHSSSLLSCFQAITVSQSNSRFMKIKQRVMKYIVPSCSFSWLAHLFLNIRIAMTVTALDTNRNFTKKLYVGYYCSPIGSDGPVSLLYFFFIGFIDILYLCIMAWTSISMVSFLYRHKKHVRNIHSSQHALRASPVARATQVILILVCTYITSYAMSFIFILYIILCNNQKLWLMNTLALLENCFPTLFPFIVMKNNNNKNNNSTFSIHFSCHRNK